MSGSQAPGNAGGVAARPFLFFSPLSIACPVSIGNQAQDGQRRHPKCAGSMPGERPPCKLTRNFNIGRKTARLIVASLPHAPAAQVREADRRALAKAVT